MEFERNLKGKVFWIPIAGSRGGHYNEYRIKNGRASIRKRTGRTGGESPRVGDWSLP